ncbi:hypothetical protein ANCCAN_13994 [Ancylostoma caninum]|uniref:Uncharacterized protein n=1 Tax=Ancylostoma caninum TaxID=29170 RepID=A0A368G9T3_ANCCA|nr:hypothetical protein ANCCAN_13994 [Ancylostoma caninum]
MSSVGSGLRRIDPTLLLLILISCSCILLIISLLSQNDYSMRETGDYKTVKETQKEYEDPDYFYGEISTCEVDSHSSRPDSSKRIFLKPPLAVLYGLNKNRL